MDTKVRDFNHQEDRSKNTARRQGYITKGHGQCLSVGKCGLKEVTFILKFLIIHILQDGNQCRGFQNCNMFFLHVKKPVKKKQGNLLCPKMKRSLRHVTKAGKY